MAFSLRFEQIGDFPLLGYYALGCGDRFYHHIYHATRWHHEIRRVSLDEWEAVRHRRRELQQQRHAELAQEIAQLTAPLQADGGAP